MDWLSFFVGALVGWIIEWLIDHFFLGRRRVAKWQKRCDDLQAENAALKATNERLQALQDQAAELNAKLKSYEAERREMAQEIDALNVALADTQHQLELATSFAEMSAGSDYTEQSTPEVEIETPEIEPEALGVDADALAVESEAPEVDIETPETIVDISEVDVETPEIEPEALGVDADALAMESEAPEVDIETPETVVDISEVDVETPEIEPEALGVDADALVVESEAPEVDIETPETVVDISEVDVETPKMDVALPQADTAIVEEGDSSLTADTPSRGEEVELPDAASQADDLRIIEGIGPKISQLLNEAGISTFAQLASADIEDLRRILANAGSRFRLAKPDTWPEQARLAADGDWEALEALQSELTGGRR